jgi:hypothetical protein
VLRTRPNWPEALALRAALLVQRAETSPPSAEQQQWLDQALKDLTAALSINHHLEHEWGSLHEKLRQAVSSPR